MSVSRFSSLRAKLIAIAVVMLLSFLVPVMAAAEESPAKADRGAADAKPAPKETPEQQFDAVWNRDKFTGEWGGWRTDLRDHGIEVGLRLSQYGQWVVDGGVDTNGEYGGTMDYRVNADLRKLFDLWDGLSVVWHTRTRFGDDISADAGAFALPNMGLIMPLPGDYNDTANTGLVISQYLPFIRGRLLNITVGKIDIVDTVSGFFPSVAFGQEGFSNVNGLVTALPWFGAVRGLSLYGGVVSTVNQEYQAAESGILVTGTTGVSTSWGSIYDAFDEGVFIAAMHRFFWKLDDKPGNVMLFAGGSTREQASNDRRDFTIIPGQGIESTDDKKPWDVAIYVHQIFWQAEGEPDRKATVFFGGTLGPDNPQFAQYHVFAAVEAFGLMTSRPHDRMGLSGWKNWLSDDFVDLVSPVADLRDTYGFELYYNMEITKWLHVTADLQIIENENDGDDLAIIPGIRVVIDF